MGLECTSPNTVSIIVQAYFLMYGVAGLLFFPLPDRWGRQKTMVVFGSLSILSTYIILFCPDFYIRVFGFGMMGVC
jgi:MFS family permease